MAVVLTIGGQKVLGTVLDQFLKAIVDAKDKAVQYTEILDRMEKRLTDIAPLVNQIEELNSVLDRPNEEVRRLVCLLRDGEALVKKCAEKVHWWNFLLNRPSYARKLLKLEEDLNRHLREIVQLQQRRDEMEILVKVNQIQATITGMGGYGGCAVPESPKFVVGLEVHLMELKDRLLRRSNVQLIVVSGPGGCGKTTLITKLCHDEDIKGHFGDQIYFVTISRMLNVKGIIQRILQYTKQPISKFQSEEDAVIQLGQRLRSIATKVNQKQNLSPILLVLDDVWSGAESLIEKFQFQIKGYKILVTSRFVFPRFNCTYSLTALNSEDATRLFREAAALQDGEAHIPSEIVEKIVKGCKGLPLALSVVGRSLCRQPLEVWMEKEQEWSSGLSRFDSEKGILERLRTSLDMVNDDKVKQCFLDLACFPEDQRIPVAVLIDMWEELYGFDGDGVKAMTTIYNLCNRNLATLTLIRGKEDQVDYWHGGQFITQHDLLRELAIHEGAQESVGLTKRLIVSNINSNFPNWWKEQRVQPVRARLLSIITDETFTSDFLDLEAPAAEVLVLNFQSKNYMLPGFVGKSQKVKVLIAKNYGFYPTELSNLHLIASLSALKRIWLEHVSIPCLGKLPTQLYNLQRVSFVMCKIDEAFKSREKSLSYLFPNLVEINLDYCDDLVELPEDVCELPHLQRLSITSCHNLSSLPEEIGKLANLEILRLASCTGLVEVPDSIGNLGKLSTLDISNCLSITTLPNQIGHLRNLQKLHMRKCLGLQGLPASIAKLDLKEVTCDEERAELWRPFERRPKIKVVKEDINLNWL